VDSYTQGDTAPAYTAVLTDGDSVYDATGATSVLIKVWRNGTLLFSRPATHVGADGVVSVELASDGSDTSDPGPLYGKVVVTNDEGEQTFPVKSFLKTIVHPASP
jgi:hypothetical protein